jgi:hypothetical protein
MRNRQRTTFPRALVLAGFAVGAVGAIVLGLSTFQSQTTSPPSSLGPAQITVTFTHQGIDPATVVLFLWLLAIPILFSMFVRTRKYYLPTLAAPAFVALSTFGWLYFYQLSGGIITGEIITSSETWVFLGDALVFFGCGLEILGIVWERMRPASAPATTQARPIRLRAGR